MSTITDQRPTPLVDRAAASDHLPIASARPAGQGVDARDAALDAVSMPVMVCDAQHQLWHVNAAARRELEAGRWLRERDGRLIGADSAIERRLARAMVLPEVASNERHETAEQCLELFNAGGAAADLLVRSVRVEACGPSWVLRLAIHGDAAHPAQLDQLSERLGLSRRQRELATLLLGGHTVTEAARRMGIVRGTAHDLLKRLFAATGTRRKTELVAHLVARISRS